MSLDFRISLDSRSLELVSKLQQAPAGLQKRVLQVFDRENLISVGRIQETKLSQRGPMTLGVVSNRLRSSLRATKAVLTGHGTIEANMGSNLIYAGPHERGFEGDVTVKSYSRRIFRYASGAATEVVFDPKTGRIQRGKTKRRRKAGTVEVRSHTRHMKVKARGYIIRTLKERGEQYAVAIGNSLKTLLQ